MTDARAPRAGWRSPAGRRVLALAAGLASAAPRRKRRRDDAHPGDAVRGLGPRSARGVARRGVGGAPRRCSARDAAAGADPHRAASGRSRISTCRPAGVAQLASLIRVGQLVAASDLIVGTLRVSGDGSACSTPGASGSTPGACSEQTTDRAPLRDLFALHDRVARRLMGGRRRRRSGAGDPPPAAAARSVRELHQGPRRRAAGDADPVPAGGARGVPELRPRPSSRCGRSRPSRATMPARSPRRRPWRPARALSRRARFAAALLADRAESVSTRRSRPSRASLDEQPAAALYNNLGVVQIRRGATPQTGMPTYFFSKAVRVRRRGVRLLLQSRLRLLARPRRPGGHLLAARSGSAQHRRRRRPFRAGRGAAGDGLGDRGRPRARAGAPVLVEVREWEKQPGRRRRRAARARAGERRTRSPARHAPRRRPARQRPARAEAARDVPSRARPPTFRSRAEPRRPGRAAQGHLPVALRGRAARADWPHLLRTGRPREAADELRVALWSRDRPGSARSRKRCSSRRHGGRAGGGGTRPELAPSSIEAKALLARIDKR